MMAVSSRKKNQEDTNKHEPDERDNEQMVAWYHTVANARTCAALSALAQTAT